MSTKLLSCMEVGEDGRDDAWFDEVLGEVPKALFCLCADSEVESESGLPFLAVRPLPTEEGVEEFYKDER